MSTRAGAGGLQGTGDDAELDGDDVVEVEDNAPLHSEPTRALPPAQLPPGAGAAPEGSAEPASTTTAGNQEGAATNEEMTPMQRMKAELERMGAEMRNELNDPSYLAPFAQTAGEPAAQTVEPLSNSRKNNVSNIAANDAPTRAENNYDSHSGSGSGSGGEGSGQDNDINAVPPPAASPLPSYLDCLQEVPERKSGGSSPRLHSVAMYSKRDDHFSAHQGDLPPALSLNDDQNDNPKEGGGGEDQDDFGRVRFQPSSSSSSSPPLQSYEPNSPVAPDKTGAGTGGALKKVQTPGGGRGLGRRFPTALEAEAMEKEQREQGYNEDENDNGEKCVCCTSFSVPFSLSIPRRLLLLIIIFSFCTRFAFVLSFFICSSPIPICLYATPAHTDAIHKRAAAARNRATQQQQPHPDGSQNSGSGDAHRAGAAATMGGVGAYDAMNMGLSQPYRHRDPSLLLKPPSGGPVEVRTLSYFACFTLALLRRVLFLSLFLPTKYLALHSVLNSKLPHPHHLFF
jgi:hypothetical protein